LKLPETNKLFSWQDFLVLFRKTLEDPEEDVCFYTIVALTHFVRRYVGGCGWGWGWGGGERGVLLLKIHLLAS
jgi:hypothetical protein